MVKIYPVHTYDFNKEGYIPKVCNECGTCSDKEEIIPETNIVKKKFSKNFIKKIVKIVCNRGRTFDYRVKDDITRHIKDQNISDPYHLAERIIEETRDKGISIDICYVINIIYKNLKPLFDFVNPNEELNSRYHAK